MAVSFENDYVMLSEERAEHINQRHVDSNRELGASKFLPFFNLTTTAAFLTRKTFKNDDDYEIVEQGYKIGHGYYYMYVFKMRKVIGICPWGYPTKEICIYFSWKPGYGDRFHIITMYPFSHEYHLYLKRRKQGLAAF